VLDALLDLLHDRATTPTSAEIADRAGLPRDALGPYFADRDALFDAAAERQLERLRRFTATMRTDGPFAARLTAFVEARAAVLEAITPISDAAFRHEPPWDAVTRHNRSVHEVGAQIAEVFAVELARVVDTDRRSRLVATIAAATNGDAWARLRHTHGLSVVAARRVLHRELRARLKGN